MTDIREALAERGKSIPLSFRFRLLPTKAQHGRLHEALEISRQIYNAALEERIDCYKKTGKGLSYFSQTAHLPEIRRDLGLDRYAWAMLAYPLQTLHKAYAGFFRRGGFPRFKGRDWYKTLGWVKAEGCRIFDGRFQAKGIGSIRIHAHRDIPAGWKYARVKRDGRNWYLIISVEQECSANNENPAIGIDMGISSLCALSDGTLILNVRADRRAHAETRRRSRALARCKRGSRRRQKVRARLRAWRAKRRRIRDTHLHQVSASLTKRFGLIGIESLNVKGLARGILARDASDVAWGRFIHMLRYKAERAGAKLVEVDPRHTSQTCPECGSIKPKTLSDRVHNCPCGCVMDRDVAAAKVVLLRAVHGPGAANVGDCAERSHEKAAA